MRDAHHCCFIVAAARAAAAYTLGIPRRAVSTFSQFPVPTIPTCLCLSIPIDLLHHPANQVLTPLVLWRRLALRGPPRPCFFLLHCPPSTHCYNCGLRSPLVPPLPVLRSRRPSPRCPPYPLLPPRWLRPGGGEGERPRARPRVALCRWGLGIPSPLTPPHTSGWCFHPARRPRRWRPW